MKMFGNKMGVIVLASMVLLVQTAIATMEDVAKATADGQDVGTLCDFCATASKRPSMAQTQELLKRADPGEKFGSASAKELLKMDHIGVQYCNLQEINNRRELCTKKVANDKDLARYCEARFDKLIEFCADNLDGVVRLEMDKKLMDNLFIAYEGEAILDVGNMETIEADLEKYFKRHDGWYDNGVAPRECKEFNRQFELVKAILDHSGQDFLRIAKIKGLLELYQIRAFCQALPDY